MKLRDWLPYEALDEEGAFIKHLDMEVVKRHRSSLEDTMYIPWIGTHKNVYNWCVLENGIAVGWNENPSIGWSFPIKRIKEKT